MRQLRLVGLMITGLLVCACSPVKTPKIQSFELTSPQPKGLLLRTASRSTLLVSMPVADPGYRSSKMIYTKIPFQLKSFSVNKWVAPPSQMLLPILLQRIRERNFYKAVVSPPFSGSTSYRLDTQLVNFQQEFFRSVSQVRLVIQANLYSNASGAVVASKRFHALIPAPGNNPYSGVLAANRAAAVVTTQIAAFCLRYSKRRSGGVKISELSLFPG
jgi:cholesterol transport system auxiliary component